MSAAAHPHRREAWGHRDSPTGRRDLPHWVDWPPGTYAGKALCGKDIVPARLDPLGTAPLVAVRICPDCVRAAEPLKRIRGGAKVVDLAARRVQRSLW